MNLTKKQRQIMTTLMDGNQDDNGKTTSWFDIEELLENLPYETSKESMQFSIRALINKELVVKERQSRRRASRIVYIPTEFAFQILRGKNVTPVLEFETFVEIV